MRRLLLTMCLAVSVCLAADPDPEPSPEPSSGNAKADLKKLQGTWSIVKLRYGGKKATPKRMNSKFTFEKNLLTINREEKAGGVNRMTLKLNAGKVPPEIDLVNARTERLMKGIYKFSGDELTIVYHTVEKARPTKFDEEGTYVWVLKRDKK